METLTLAIMQQNALIATNHFAPPRKALRLPFFRLLKEISIKLQS
jgi:hypothetical protein